MGGEQRAAAEGWGFFALGRSSGSWGGECLKIIFKKGLNDGKTDPIRAAR